MGGAKFGGAFFCACRVGRRRRMMKSASALGDRPTVPPEKKRQDTKELQKATAIH